MAMNKKEQEALKSLEEQNRVLAHTVNPALTYAGKIATGDGVRFRVVGSGLELRVQKGQVKGDYWYANIIEANRFSSTGGRIYPYEACYENEADAYFAMYLRIRDASAVALEKAWSKYQKSLNTDKAKEEPVA